MTWRIKSFSGPTRIATIALCEAIRRRTDVHAGNGETFSESDRTPLLRESVFAFYSGIDIVSEMGASSQHSAAYTVPAGDPKLRIWINTTAKKLRALKVGESYNHCVVGADHIQFAQLKVVRHRTCWAVHLPRFDGPILFRNVYVAAGVVEGCCVGACAYKAQAEMNAV